jgi:hypothetical protein
MRQAFWKRFVPLWLAFGVGMAAGVWLASRHGTCRVQLYDVNTDAFVAAVQSATVAATTGSGTVSFDLGSGSIRIQAESAFENQSYDQTLPALVRGSPMSINVSSRLLTRLSGVKASQ